MANYDAGRLDRLFAALADPTRRAVVDRLGRGPASVSELAEPFGMALPSFLKHIRALEESGCIRTRKTGRVRTCSLDRGVVSEAEAWLHGQRLVWEERTDRLEAFVLDRLPSAPSSAPSSAAAAQPAAPSASITDREDLS
jgi:DNA-binding transcriptional ArsR family regulator